MHFRSRQNSQAIFRQLGEYPEPNAVHTLIENHDAVLHNDHVLSQINAQVVAQLKNRSVEPQLAAKIAHQRAALAPLVVSLAQTQLRAG